MANIEEVPGVFGGVKTDIGENPEPIVTNVSTNLPAKVGFWNKVKSVLFYEVKVELTPYGIIICEFIMLIIINRSALYDSTHNVQLSIAKSQDAGFFIFNNDISPPTIKKDAI